MTTLAGLIYCFKEATTLTAVFWQTLHLYPQLKVGIKVSVEWLEL